MVYWFILHSVSFKFDFGGSDSASSKEEIDQIFDKENVFLRLDSKTYEQSLVSATSDGASVNFGAFITMVSQQRKQQHVHGC